MGRTIIIKEKISVMISVNRRLNSYLIYFKKPWKGQAGSALIGLIVTMVFLSALAAAMIAQTTTGSLGFVNENSSLRAYYLAESGFRYAAAKLKHKASLDDLHSHGSFSLGDKGSFTLAFTTYIFEVTGGIGTNELVTKASFGKAPFLENNPGYLKVGDNSVQAFDAVVVDLAPNDNVVRFTNNTQTWNVLVGEDVKLVVKSNGDAVSEGGDLNLQAGSSDAFPLYNGRFKADGKTYQYKKRETDKLVGIMRVDSSTWVAPSLSNGDDIVLQAFAQLTSTGTYGEGDMAVSREIVYNIPLSTSEKAEFYDTFDTKDNWEEVSTLGTHSTEIIAGVLKVTGAGSVGGTDVGSLIKIDSSKVDAILERAHASAGNFLSYDTQVKVGFDLSVPSSYMPGISFRQDAEDSLGTTTGNSYGVSFLKGGSSDGIPDALVPYNDCPIIVLWQQTNSGTDKKWLAYKHLIGRPIYLSDDMESGTSKWTADPPWAQITSDFHSTTTCWTDSPVGNYADNIDISLTTSQSIDLSGISSATLSFWHKYHIEQFPLPWGDWGAVEISTDGGSHWTELTRYEGNQSTWTNVALDISDYLPSANVKIRFKLHTDFSVVYDGWYIDDVTIAANFPINEAAIMARVKEAATLSFTGGGATPIEAGDIVYQATGRGTVLGTPILASGSWKVGGNATGIILLNKISGSFTASQPLYVDGTALATTASGAGFYRARDNYIRVYYGDKDGYGAPGTDPLDYDKHGNLRGELHWPPDEVDDTDINNDYFTLVGWDTDNTDLDSVNGEGIFGTGKELDAIIRLNALTTSTGTFTDTEIGLHTFGINSTSVYFDDFGLQTDVPTSEGFLPAVQQ